MAKEHTLVGLNRPTMALITLIVLLFAAGAFWSDRGSDSATAVSAINQGISSNTNRNDNQDKQIAETQKEIKAVKNEQHKAEIARVQMVSDISETKIDVGEIKDDFRELKGYLMQYDFGKKEGK